MIQVLQRSRDEWHEPVRELLGRLGPRAGVAFEHDPRWLAVLEEALGHRTYALLAWEEGGEGGEGGGGGGATTAPAPRLRGYLPLALVSSRLFGRFLVSLPYLNRGGVVAEDDAVADELLDAAVEMAGRLRVKHLELRHHAQPVTHRSISRNRDDKPIMLLDLPGSADDLWAGLSAKVRNQVRKGQKAGLTIRWGGQELLDGFYDVFSVNMRDLGTPVYPRRLFERILTHFPDEAELTLVELDSRPVAGALLIHQPDGATQTPSASCLRAFNHTNANMWMYHHLLVRAIERGAGVFDFGRSSVDSGPFRFKKQWGAVPQATTWQYHVRRGELAVLRREDPKMQRRIDAWRKLPIWVTRMVGPAIVRGIP